MHVCLSLSHSGIFVSVCVCVSLSPFLSLCAHVYLFLSPPLVLLNLWMMNTSTI